MISKIEISGSNYKLEDNFKKYATKKIGKLDRHLPRGHKKDVVAKVVVTEVNHGKGNKFEISCAMEIPGGKVISAKRKGISISGIGRKRVTAIRRVK